MAGREDEAVAVLPMWVAGIVAQGFGVEKVRERGVGHRGAGVARISFLDGVHGESADGIDAQLGYVHTVIGL